MNMTAHEATFNNATLNLHAELYGWILGNLTMADAEFVVTAKQAQLVIDATADFVETTALTINTTVNATIVAAEEFADSIVELTKGEILAYAEAIIDGLTAFTDGAIDDISYNVGGCRLLSNLYDASIASVCKTVQYTIDAYWWGVGLVAFMLIPNIILSVKIAKYFKRMEAKYYDGYTNGDDFEMSELPPPEGNKAPKLAVGSPEEGWSEGYQPGQTPVGGSPYPDVIAIGESSMDMKQP